MSDIVERLYYLSRGLANKDRETCEMAIDEIERLRKFIALQDTWPDGMVDSFVDGEVYHALSVRVPRPGMYRFDMHVKEDSPAGSHTTITVRLEGPADVWINVEEVSDE